MRVKVKVSLGEFWGETQGGPGLQIDKDKYRYKAKYTKTKTKTKYKAKYKAKTKTKYRHRYTKKTSTLQTKTKTCSVPSSAKRTNLSGGLACLLWNPGETKVTMVQKGVNEAIIGAGNPGRDLGAAYRGRNQESFQFFPVFSRDFHFVTLCQLGGETPGVNGDFLESPRNTLGGGLGPKEGLPQGPFLRETPWLGTLARSPFYEKPPGWVH